MLQCAPCSRYNYSRDDEEIYKEFLEIAHELIVHTVKIAGEGVLLGSTHRTAIEFAAQALTEVEAKAERKRYMAMTPFLEDIDNYVSLLRLYDGLCKWEEGSQLPVLHVTWAKHFASCVLRFDKGVRAQLTALLDHELESSVSDADSDVKSSPECVQSSPSTKSSPEEGKASPGGVKSSPSASKKSASPNKASPPSAKLSQLDFKSSPSDVEKIDTPKRVSLSPDPAEKASPKEGSSQSEIGSPVSGKEEAGSGSPEAVSRKSSTEGESEAEPSIEDIAKQCSSELLNPDFLRGKGRPFEPKSGSSSLSPGSTKSSGSGCSAGPSEWSDVPPTKRSRASPEAAAGGKLRFRSAKMRGMTSLLTSERLNLHAISLQLTAQSQVSKKTPGSKRSRNRRSETGQSG